MQEFVITIAQLKLAGTTLRLYCSVKVHEVSGIASRPSWKAGTACSREGVKLDRALPKVCYKGEVKMPLLHTLRRSALISISLCLLIVLVLTACGSKTTTGDSSTTGSSPAVTATGTSSTPSSNAPTTQTTPAVVKGYGTTNGCPSDAVVDTKQFAANVVVTLDKTKDPIPVHVGDHIEIRLPFGKQWQGPPATYKQTVMTPQQPAGFANKAEKACVWNFIAKQSGTAEIVFTDRPLCKPRQMCPMYIMDIPFTFKVQ